MTDQPVKQDTRGLAGQVIGDTGICAVTQTQLMYRGYEIADLAEHATFEEVAHVLLVGHRPSPGELAAFKAELADLRPIPPGLASVLEGIAGDPPGSHPMSILRTAVSWLSHHDPDTEDTSPEAELRVAMRLLARIPTIIGHGQGGRDGRTPVEPDPGLDHAANLLWCLTGERPDDPSAHVMDVSLILYAEHDFNASTFAGRVIAATMSDLYSAVCGAIGALKGPLHGGANEKAMEMLAEIQAHVDEGGTVEAWMASAFESKRMLMGFGHRVYRGGDHRSGILGSLGRRAAEVVGPEATALFDLGDRVQAIMLEQKGIHANVDFPCGMTYHTLGIPIPQYTPIFVASRITGWCAHIMEQHRNNRLIRPLADYTGPSLRMWQDD